jgi:hypothetical protein
LDAAAGMDIRQYNQVARLCYRFTRARRRRKIRQPCIRSGAKSKLRINGKMAERPVLVGVIPQAVVLDDGDQIAWLSDGGNLRVEFDVNRCPFSSNVFQAPAGMRLLSGPARPGIKAGNFRYRLWLNDQLVGQGEVILRDK